MEDKKFKELNVKIELKYEVKMDPEEAEELSKANMNEDEFSGIVHTEELQEIDENIADCISVVLPEINGQEEPTLDEYYEDPPDNSIMTRDNEMTHCKANEIFDKESRNVYENSFGKLFNCEHCEYGCNIKAYMDRHLELHDSEKSYKCEHCAYRCASRKDLVIHLRSHTGEKPYSCKYCNFRSADKRIVVRHERKHRDDKPLSCEQCSYRCWDMYRLVDHKRTHIGEKTVKCPFCDFKCSARLDFAKHRRSHTLTDDKPFKCNLCEYKCAQKCTLVRHIRKHTGE